jgi:HNH endonuclease/AP2 domain
MAEAKKPRLSSNGKITFDQLRALVSYDPETGHFTWKPRGIAKWDPKYAGKRAGHLNTTWGYWYITLKRVGSFRANRLAWFYMTGSWPGETVDHRDGNPLNDRFENLRMATRSQNQHNRLQQKNNKSGTMGINWRESKQRWRAYLSVMGKQTHVGYFRTKEEAIEARQAAAQKYYGEFAPAA